MSMSPILSSGSSRMGAYRRKRCSARSSCNLSPTLPVLRPMNRRWQTPFIMPSSWGWKTNGIWAFMRGQPVALQLDGGTSLPTYGTQRPNLTGTLTRNTGSDFLDNYFANPEVAVAPAPFTLGTAPRTLPNLRNPGINIANLSFFKEIPLGHFREGMHLEYRVEAFNAFNHPQFC